MEMRRIDLSRMDLNKLIEKGIEFHGHLGPFLIVGIKMGLLALRKLESKGYFDLNAKVETGIIPPLSCLADGIQISTGCTLGKGNIKIIKKGTPKAEFSKDGKHLSVELKPEVFEAISEGKPKALAQEVIGLTEEELFQWKLQ
jgi:formylmethanofuran dehydrogenase subunit E